MFVVLPNLPTMTILFPEQPDILPFKTKVSVY